MHKGQRWFADPRACVSLRFHGGRPHMAGTTARRRFTVLKCRRAAKKLGGPSISRHRMLTSKRADPDRRAGRLKVVLLDPAEQLDDDVVQASASSAGQNEEKSCSLTAR